MVFFGTLALKEILQEWQVGRENVGVPWDSLCHSPNWGCGEFYHVVLVNYWLFWIWVFKYVAHKPQPLGMAGGGTKASFYGCLLCWVHHLEIFPLLIRGQIHDTCFMCKAAIITGNREPCPCFPLSFRISWDLRSFVRILFVWSAFAMEGWVFFHY